MYDLLPDMPGRSYRTYERSKYSLNAENKNGLSYANSLAQKPAQALSAIRRTITEGGAISFEEGMKIEHESALKLAGTKDFSEGIRAFLEKREPKWA